MLNRIFGTKKEEVRGEREGDVEEDCAIKSFIICTLQQVLLG